MNGQIARQRSQDPIAAVEELAAEVLGDLYEALAGERPRAVRVYRDGDSLLILIRFDPTPLEDGPDWRERLEATFIATLELLAEVVGRRCGCRLDPGGLELCGSGRLAAFSLSVGRAGAAAVPVPLAEQTGRAP